MSTEYDAVRETRLPVWRPGPQNGVWVFNTFLVFSILFFLSAFRGSLSSYFHGRWRAKVSPIASVSRESDHVAVHPLWLVWMLHLRVIGTCCHQLSSASCILGVRVERGALGSGEVVR